jgi:hypothetical protein
MNIEKSDLCEGLSHCLSEVHDIFYDKIFSIVSFFIFFIYSQVHIDIYLLILDYG